LADLREALSSIMSRLSEGPQEDAETEQEADWFMFSRAEVNWSQKPRRPYLRLVAGEDVGRTTIYPRCSSKDDCHDDRVRPDMPFPDAVGHRAHSHPGKKCELNKDATVIASAPIRVGSYLFRGGRRRECPETDRNWLRLFRSALQELETQPNTAERRSS
jgi:hypothetical protein